MTWRGVLTPVPSFPSSSGAAVPGEGEPPVSVQLG